MTDSPAIVHLARLDADESDVRTLCGIWGHASKRHTQKAKQGPWVSCPLCEAAASFLEESKSAADQNEGAESWT
ncbi:hypothetical protein Uis1B_0200 [Bifidobacterium margollesii]|uniref:Uncharacterized protein n=1 Tax=Bifidobacterium margollesii TaxID=2020964 RepID=A0A2N5JD14_9BIFI|nr:hypothetical protein [Bifidobacterium margollesii]PLS32107.1 hypothetical protein Uis1B_0200 [Bifidobacterium margollesii]